MKKVAIFFSGFIFAFLLLGAGAYFYISETSKAPSAPVSIGEIAKRDTGPRVEFIFPLAAPPPLADALQQKSGSVFSVRLFSTTSTGQQRDFRILEQKVTDQNQISIKVAAQDLLGSTLLNDLYLLAVIRYCYGNVPAGESCDGIRASSLEARSANLISKEKISSERKIKFPTVYFTRSHKVPQERCSVPADRNLISGTVLATDDFIRNLPAGKKVALLGVQSAMKDQKPTMKLGVQPDPFSVTPIDAAKLKEGATFALPANEESAVASNLISMVAIICDPNEDLRACARSKSIEWSAPADPNRLFFRLVKKDFQIALCGDRDAVFYLHWNPKYIPGSEPRPLRSRVPSAPVEIIEQVIF